MHVPRVLFCPSRRLCSSNACSIAVSLVSEPVRTAGRHRNVIESRTLCRSEMLWTVLPPGTGRPAIRIGSIRRAAKGPPASYALSKAVDYGLTTMIEAPECKKRAPPAESPVDSASD